MPQTRSASRMQEQDSPIAKPVSTTADATPEKKMETDENIDPMAVEQMQQYGLDSFKPGEVLLVKEPAAKKKKNAKKAKKGKKDKTETVVVDVDEIVEPVVEEREQDALVQVDAGSGVATGAAAAAHDEVDDDTVTQQEAVTAPAIHVTIAEPSTLTAVEQDGASSVKEQSTVAIEAEQEDTTHRQAEVDSALAALEGRTVTTPAAMPSRIHLSVSPNARSPRSEDAIDEIDALEDALEEIGKSLPNMPLSPEKPKRKQAKISEGTNAKKPAVLKPVKSLAPIAQVVARKSAVKPPPPAKPKDTVSLLRTTQPSAAASRATAARGQTSRAVSASLTVSKRPVATTKKVDAASAPSKPVDYLASKRRPISMQFPPPPAPIKSTKAPTRPTFTLPGEAISARKKALHEEKLKKEEEELQRRRSFRPRPVPESIRARPSSMIVKQNASSRARMSIIGSTVGSPVDRTESASPANTGLKRSNTTTALAKSTSPKVSAITAKRMSMKENALKASANTSVKRDGTSNKTVATTSVTTKRNSMMPFRPSLSTSTNTSKQPSRATGAAPRPKSMIVPRQSTGVKPTATEALALKAKAKSIYNRDCNGGDILQRERREKEEAAKRARAEAAEKGRQASREWAEKQRKKMMDAKLAQQLKQQQQPAVAAA